PRRCSTWRSQTENLRRRRRRHGGTRRRRYGLGAMTFPVPGTSGTPPRWDAAGQAALRRCPFGCQAPPGHRHAGNQSNDITSTSSGSVGGGGGRDSPHTRRPMARARLPLVLLACALVLSACGGGGGGSTPTISVGAARTFALDGFQPAGNLTAGTPTALSFRI